MLSHNESAVMNASLFIELEEQTTKSELTINHVYI